MRVAIIQENAPDCELHREVIEIPEHASMDDVDNAISAVLDGLMFSVGDRIKIVELEGKSMQNRAMQRKLDNLEAVDLSQCAKLGPYYVLEEFEEGVDYCDAELEAWIWSIGRATHSVTQEIDGVTHVIPAGRILASTGTAFYQNPAFECLFLR